MFVTAICIVSLCFIFATLANYTHMDMCILNINAKKEKPKRISGFMPNEWENMVELDYFRDDASVLNISILLYNWHVTEGRKKILVYHFR